jgi:uncharacterized membrane protein YeaQ/YmgE (transglycosylase-associated protein family)
LSAESLTPEAGGPNFKREEKVMDAQQWIIQFLLGGLMGMTGQALRVVAGLKKVNDQALQQKKPFGELFETSSLFISLLIGFVAGAVAVLAMSSDNGVLQPNKQVILGLIGAGYAGTDFIEGFIKKYLPAGSETTKSPESNEQPQQPAVG